MINRIINSKIINRLSDRKAIILLGPRQVGKSTLIEQLESSFAQPVMVWNGDESDIRDLLKNPSSTKLKSLIGNAKTLIIDEAQRIEDIGLTLKLIVDQIKDVKVIATGSSAFELSNKTNEPLTGRKWEYKLYPISFEEMVNHHGLLNEKRLLHQRMVFGYYPEIINHPGEEIPRLKQLVDSYLFKDILIWERILKPEKLEKLLQALAFQVGSEVSYNELGQLAGLDNQTVEKYIQLLEKAFIIFRLSALSRNLRNELKKSRKIYFYDNGLRNAIINNFNAVTLRDDIGALWENFLMSERQKLLAYKEIYCLKYFWRTHTQQEIDYLEESNGEMNAYEFKWNAKAKVKFSKSFIESYHPKNMSVINSDNFEEFLLNE
ncbi:ATP-binding protein [Pedobacter alpinus]|uniref:ATP-binding protein n=1 Tax=Pedobacter alpinus TaxID=1590643 RepID=A0ABW5TR10_9SPHI